MVLGIDSDFQATKRIEKTENEKKIEYKSRKDKVITCFFVVLLISMIIANSRIAVKRKEEKTAKNPTIKKIRNKSKPSLNLKESLFHRFKKNPLDIGVIQKVAEAEALLVNMINLDNEVCNKISSISNKEFVENLSDLITDYSIINSVIGELKSNGIVSMVNYLDRNPEIEKIVFCRYDLKLDCLEDGSEIFSLVKLEGGKTLREEDTFFNKLKQSYGGDRESVGRYIYLKTPQFYNLKERIEKVLEKYQQLEKVLQDNTNR